MWPLWRWSSNPQNPSESRKVGNDETETVLEQDLSVRRCRETRAKSYGDVRVDDNGTSWQGDNHGTLVHNHYHLLKSQPDKYRKLLKSLTFDHMDSRLRNVAKALPSTCQWLFTHEDFQAWTDPSRIQEHYGLLWIKGKPGSGKSTIMKETVAWAERTWPAQIVLRYFFNARSQHELEKSSLGLYRSLVHQLLTAFPAAQPFFTSRFEAKEGNSSVVEIWTETELQNFLVDLVMNDAQLPRVTILVDALDEGNEDDIRSMIGFFEVLAQRAISAGVKMYVCVSSRHYPQISLRQALSIVVENQAKHKQDIEVYVCKRLLDDSELQTSELRQKVCDRSAGIFLWVVLVVAMLNKLYDQGKPMATMLKKLDTIPQDLHRVFASILSRDQESTNERHALFRWMLYSKRPLGPDELYVAVQTSIPGGLPMTALPTAETMMRYLLNCSCGLVELTITEQPVMQFIHETVRDFLTGTSYTDPYTLNTADPEDKIPGFQADRCHTTIAEECLQYLIGITSEASSNEHVGEHVAEELPLIDYAARYWWQHAQSSQEPRSVLLSSLSWELLTNERTFLTWRQHYDVDGSYSNKHHDHITEPAPLIYYAAHLCLPELVQKLCEQSVDVNAQGGLFGYALQVAAIHGHEKIAQILLDEGANVNAQHGPYDTALQAASHFGQRDIVIMLLQHGADVDAWGGANDTAIKAAAARGHGEIVQLLMENGADIKTNRCELGTALTYASMGNNMKMLQTLLKNGADANAIHGESGPALYLASRKGHEKAVKLLLEHGAAVNGQGGAYWTALQAASLGGFDRIVRILMEHGADVNAQGGSFGTALQAACEYGYGRIVRMLLNGGADVNVKGGKWGTALNAATGKGHTFIVRLLLDNGADVNIPEDEMNNTVLHTAIEYGREEVVPILLAHGADVNTKGEWGTALQLAKLFYYPGIWQTLINYGAHN